jgi:hypothetical protein
LSYSALLAGEKNVIDFGARKIQTHRLEMRKRGEKQVIRLFGQTDTWNYIVSKNVIDIILMKILEIELRRVTRKEGVKNQQK